MNFHELVRMWGLILNNLIGYLECSVVKLFVMMEGGCFELLYLKGLEDLGMAMMVKRLKR